MRTLTIVLIVLFSSVTYLNVNAQNSACNITSIKYNPNVPVIWSHDSSMFLVNQLDTAGVFQIYIGKKGSSTLTCISDTGPWQLFRPWIQLNKFMVNWDPTGKYIICGVEKDIYNELFYVPYSLRLAWLESGVWLDIWACTPNGKNWYNLATTVHGYTGVAFTPGGKKGAWAQMLDTSATGAIFGVWQLELSTYDTTGGPHFNTTTNINPTGSTWVEPGDFSPVDSNLLLINSDIGMSDPEGQDQFILNISNGKLINLTKSPKIWDEHGVWSPDGEKVLLMSSYPYRNDTNSYHILTIKTEFLLINVDTLTPYSGVQQLTHFDTTGYLESDSGIAATGYWRPDGTTIYAQSLITPRYANWIITFEGPCGNDNTTSINDLQPATGSLIFPNPAGNFINIKLTSNNNPVVYSIYNLLGNKIKEGQVSSTQLTLDISSYSNGLYLITLYDGATTITKKFAVVK